MKRKYISFTAMLACCLCFCISANLPGALAEAADGGDVQQVISNLRLSGGVSGGGFYASNPGAGGSQSEFLLSNLLVALSYDDEALPIGFVAAFGETSTPSVLDAPENNKILDIEYAGITMAPAEGLALEVGLLGPNSGFEETYTFNNSHILLGAVASQQPYNAYGAKFGYEAGALSFWGGYYGDRLDDEEYGAPADAWELGVVAELAGNVVGFYHYHVGGYRYLTGMVIERTIEGMDIGINVDYWAWADRMKGFYGDNRAIGGAVYVNQHFGDFSIPLRIEYIYQGESEIYIESASADSIFTATITPTWHFRGSAYARAEASWVSADGGFEDKDGGSEDGNIGLAVEFGVTF